MFILWIMIISAQQGGENPWFWLSMLWALWATIQRVSCDFKPSESDVQTVNENHTSRGPWGFLGSVLIFIGLKKTSTLFSWSNLRCFLGTSYIFVVCFCQHQSTTLQPSLLHVALAGACIAGTAGCVTNGWKVDLNKIYLSLRITRRTTNINKSYKSQLNKL